MGKEVLHGDVPGPVPRLQSAMMDAVTKAFLQANPDLSDADPNEVLWTYTEDMRNAFELWNLSWQTVKLKKDGNPCEPMIIMCTGGHSGIMYPKDLPGYVIGDLLMHRYKFANINLANISGATPGDCELGVYIDHGEQEGIYDISDDTKLRIFKELCPQLSDVTSKLFAEIEKRIKIQAPVIQRTGDGEDEKHFVPVKNGIFDLKDKVLLPFSSDFVYVSKAEVKYDPNATSPVITEQGRDPWEFESWLLDLVSGVEEDRDALLQSMTFGLRPASESSKSMYWISDNFGASGKGTLAQVEEDLLGGRTVKHANLDDISGEYMLYDMPYKSLIIGLDNERGYILDKSNTLKLLSTKEAIQANRKYRSPITFKFIGQNLQLMNGYPILKDKSDSNLRRIWMFSFNKTFAEDEKAYIKKEYLRRPEVLEYVMKRLLELPYLEELPETVNTEACMSKLREVNSVVYDFVAELMPKFPAAWDVYDGLALYKIFTMWTKDHGRDEQFTIKSARFYDELTQALRNAPKYGFLYDAAKCLTAASDEIKPIQAWDKMENLWYGVATYMHSDFVSGQGTSGAKKHNLRVRDDGQMKFVRGCIVRVKPAA